MPNVLHRAIVGTISSLTRLGTWLRIEGRERIPAGGAVLVFNHPGYIDPVYVQAGHGKPLYFLGKKEAFEWPAVGWILRNVGGQIPLDRQAGGNVEALEEAIEHLRRGEKVALAPEGTHSAHRALGRGRTGAARLALAAGVPVVPVAVFHSRPPRVVFGEPLSLEAWRGKAEDHVAVRAATDHMMGAIAALLGEAYDPATAPDYAKLKGLKPLAPPP